MGALPTVYAAVRPTCTEAITSDPTDGRDVGTSAQVGRSSAAQDTAAAARLWEVSERLTNVHYTF